MKELELLLVIPSSESQIWTTIVPLGTIDLLVNVILFREFISGKALEKIAIGGTCRPRAFTERQPYEAIHMQNS
jgi:hypothetical protein